MIIYGYVGFDWSYPIFSGVLLSFPFTIRSKVHTLLADFSVPMLAESMCGICASGNAPDEISYRCIRFGDNLPSFPFDSSLFSLHHLLMLLP